MNNIAYAEVDELVAVPELFRTLVIECYLDDLDTVLINPKLRTWRSPLNVCDSVEKAFHFVEICLRH